MCQLPRSPLIRSFFILQELRHAQTLLPTKKASVSSTFFGAAASFPRSIRIPSIRLSLREAAYDSSCRRPDISYRIDSCFHLRFIGLQCLNDVPGDPRDEKPRTFSSNSKRSHILRTSSRSRRLILSSIVSLAVSQKCTRTI